MHPFLRFVCVMAFLHGTYGADGSKNPNECKKSNQQGLVCFVSVRIKCEMDDGQGQGGTIDCLNPDPFSHEPFLTLPPNPIPENLCGDRNVTISYKLCNRGDNPITIDRGLTFIKFMGNQFNWKWKTDKLNPPNEKVTPRKTGCWTPSFNVIWDPCEMAKNRTKVSFAAQIRGRIIGNEVSSGDNNSNAFCFCNVYKGASVEQIAAPPIQTCEQYQKFRITEIVDGKYVEIHNDLCIGMEVAEELYLVRIPFEADGILNDGKGNFKNAYDIKAVTSGGAPADGFLLACDPSIASSDSGGICDGGLDNSFSVNSGKDSYAIVRVREHDIQNYEIIDIYGSMSSFSDRSNQDISGGGRAARDTDISAGTSTFWQPSEWYITRDAKSGPVFDPRSWTNAPEPGVQFIITEITNPPPLPNGLMPPKYIELYTSSGKGNSIDESIQLVIFHGSNDANDVVSEAVVDLQGARVPPDGFFLVCNGEARVEYGDAACDIVLDNSHSPVTADGDDNIAIIRGDLRNDYVVLDIFGRIGFDGSTTSHDFVDARVVRNIDLFPFQNNGIWNPKGWYILPYKVMLSEFDPSDPRQWNTPPTTNLPLMPIVTPTNRPSPRTPTVAPTVIASRKPTAAPTEDDIEVLITEITDPFDGQKNRFVEIYFPSHSNYVIAEDLLIVRFEGANSYPNDHIYFNLRGYSTNKNGFMVFCVDKLNYGDRCDFMLGPDTIADNSGNFDIAIMRGASPSVNGKILDIYGNPGRQTFPFESFVGGRVSRRSAPRNPTFIYDNWDVSTVLASGFADPGCWNDIGDCIREPTTTPTNSPTAKPTKPPSYPGKPTDEPTGDPSNKPTATPTITPPISTIVTAATEYPTNPPITSNPSNPRKTKNPSKGVHVTPYTIQVLITEIADPSDGEKGRFIEIFFPFHKNYSISEDLLIVRFEGESLVPVTFPYINLKGLSTNEHGFMVFCVDHEVYEDRCDYALGRGTIADNPGDVDIAIMTGNLPNAGGKIIDIYGVPGQQTYMFQSFVGGRINRRYGISNPVFDYGNWDISPGYIPNAWVPISGTDPGCWRGIGHCSIPTTPATPTTPSSPKAGKAGKSYPGTKRGRARRTRKP